MDAASKLTLLAAGIFLLTGLLTGAWKYVSIVRSRRREARRYVSVAHMASLMYAFAALILYHLLQFSPYSESMKLAAVGVPLFFFAASIANYIAHGILGDTDNQFRRPYRLGGVSIAPAVLHTFVALTIIGEIGGFLILFVGYLETQVLK